MHNPAKILWNAKQIEQVKLRLTMTFRRKRVLGKTVGWFGWFEIYDSLRPHHPQQNPQTAGKKIQNV